MTGGGHRFFMAVEGWLESEREQLPLWIPVGLGLGIGAWFSLPNPLEWLGFCCCALAIACGGMMLPAGGRLRQSMILGGLLAAFGCVLIWCKAVAIGSAPLPRAIFMEVTGEVRTVDAVPAEQMSRVKIRPMGTAGLPPLIRVNMAAADVPDGLGRGAIIRFRARLMPPAEASLPGAYDFSRRAYFQGIGATGRALRPITVLRPSTDGPPLRNRLFAHILEKADGDGTGIAAALATGDQGAISEADAEAMRRSGLAHLLSISGLHVTALIGAVIFLLMRIMALSPRAALNWPLMLVAAAGGALAGIGYTLLTGAEVPTVRSCVAALLVLGGLALGREAITLRLIAAGALVVLLLWPEALVGPSFQMSFGAVIALVALSEHPRFRAFAAAREETGFRRLMRHLVILLLSGFAVELVLAPIALAHFHKAGMLGAFANLIAIPLTTFVVMPLEAIALLLDVAGLGAPAWWLTGRALELLLMIAHGVAAGPWAVVTAPVVPNFVFGMMVLGGLWCLLWRSAWRWCGLAPVAAGVAVIVLSSPPDILVTADGRHVAVREQDGGMAILRARAGDYVRDMIAESAGYEGTLNPIAQLPEARCSIDLCMVAVRGGGRLWQLLVTRTGVVVPRESLQRDCARADIVIADRRMPAWCRPRWLKADRRMLARTGGLAIDLDGGTVRTAKKAGDAHPWVVQPSYLPSRHKSDQLYRRSNPASLP
ncbi:ComEC/Rec2 family competence protein [Novosphingobium sp. Chol11]|uniref:ComEC/Rec2 family competence protein n=1 Tax=Novosphingobium sp. Chol11 TaxID=1385763 RepID=UPI0020D25942|nr:ComEC/Rec2 family competence protein [Novosphingobium sp. Chol11]